jgi:hypothetical protein
VELDEIDRVDAQSLERSFQAGAGGVTAPVAGLRCQEEVLSVRRHPWSKPKLGIPVIRSDVDVGDAEFEKDRQQLVGSLLAHPAESRSTENGAAALMSSPAELSVIEH